MIHYFGWMSPNTTQKFRISYYSGQKMANRNGFLIYDISGVFIYSFKFKHSMTTWTKVCLWYHKKNVYTIPNFFENTLSASSIDC